MDIVVKLKAKEIHGQLGKVRKMLNAGRTFRHGTV